ncbi:MAG TPA: cupin domain-containing protein [Terriglobales bacterium]|nr:cupin domain-containing protein [Terriglobales bacterium]
MHIDWSQVPAEKLSPLITRKCVHHAGMTIAYFHLKKGAIVPLHHHINAQVTNVLSGALKFTLDGKELTVRGGHSLAIEPDVPHEAVAEEDCEVLDIFVPERADWIANDDTYLRAQAAKK